MELLPSAYFGRCREARADAGLAKSGSYRPIPLDGAEGPSRAPPNRLSRPARCGPGHRPLLGTRQLSRFIRSWAHDGSCPAQPRAREGRSGGSGRDGSRGSIERQLALPNQPSCRKVASRLPQDPGGRPGRQTPTGRYRPEGISVLDTRACSVGLGAAPSSNVFTPCRCRRRRWGQPRSTLPRARTPARPLRATRAPCVPARRPVDVRRDKATQR